MSKRVTIDDATADVLSRATVNGNVVILPAAQLDRALYVSVDKALKALGGKWNRGKGGHVFDSDPAVKLAAALDAGHAVSLKALGYFPTPALIVRRLLALADVQPHHRALEPSAGQGAIADALAEIVGAGNLTVVELQEENVRALVTKGYDVIHGDFMETRLSGFDRVVMNPPFERQQDVDHVLHAFDALKPGGRLVSVMAGHHSGRRADAFSEVLSEHGWSEENPRGSFKEADTLVHSQTVVMDRPIAAEMAA